MHISRLFSKVARVFNQSNVGTTQYKTVQQSIAHVNVPLNWFDLALAVKPCPPGPHRGESQNDSLCSYSEWLWTQPQCASQSKAEASIFTRRNDSRVFFKSENGDWSIVADYFATALEFTTLSSSEQMPIAIPIKGTCHYYVQHVTLSVLGCQ